MAGTGPEREPRAGPDRVLELLTDAARARARTAPPGYLELPGSAPETPAGPAQRLMLSPVLARVYERMWRPALGRVAKGLLGPGMAEERRIARLMLSPRRGGRILDVACGTGSFTRDFGRAVGPEGLAVGLDVSEAMLTRAVGETPATALPQVVYLRADAQELPFRAATFDGVCCFAALHLMADPGRALDRMTRILAPGGRIAIFTSIRGRSTALRAAESLIGRSSGMRMFERDEVLAALERRGFAELRRHATGVTQFVGGRLAPR